MINHTLEGASGPMRYNPDTTETAKALARAIGAGPTMMPGANPIMTEEYLRQWAGPAPYYAVFDIWAPIWRQLTPEASLEIRKGNYQRIFDEGRRRVRAWEKTNVK